MSYNMLSYEELVRLAEAVKAEVYVAPNRGIADVVVNYYGTVVAKERPRTGKAGHMYTPTATRRFEEAVAKAGLLTMQQLGYDQCLAMPVAIGLSIKSTVPASFSREETELALRGYSFPDQQDTDNKVKSILDGMNGIVLKDDKQVCRMFVTDSYSEAAGFTLTVKPIGLTRAEVKRLGAILKGL